MNEEIDESEFYHQDFTTASEWEIFCARLEEIIHQWKVDDLKTEDASISSIQGPWNIKEEKVQFADVEFILSYFKNTTAVEQSKSVDDDDDTKKYKHPMDNLHDFVLHDTNTSSIECPLATWYGLDQFITLNFGPYTNGITSESQIKLLLSSVQLAISSTNCVIPVFVKIREQWQNCYMGVYEDEQVRTNFEMVHLRKGPQHCQYLTGLLDLFKTKIMSPINLDPINVSVQFTYHLNEFGKYTWKQDLQDIDHENFDIVTSVFMLPFGVTHDPISEIVLKTTWSHLPDHLIVDSENYSDFDPMQAPKWSIQANISDQPICLLAEALSDAVNALNTKSTIYEILGDFISSDHNIDNPLDLLTEPKLPTLSTVLKRAARSSLSRSSKGAAPIAEEILVPILYFLFPDADEESTFPYCIGQEKSNGDNIGSSETTRRIDNECRGFKTCKEGSLLYRLSIVFVQALGMLGGSRAAAHLWFEFVQEMRYRWEKTIFIPGLVSGFPDSRTCLLNQKLQMLNCCIDRKRARETRESTDTNVERRAEENSSTDDEEFYDCSQERTEEEENRKKTKHSLWNQPIGRLGKFENLKLINTGDVLYIPITQDPAPKTEDQLEEDTDFLLKLGSDAQGSELRAKMMSASLLSDMESFKAANPGSILEDFIRWYSPRDWIEEDELDQWGQKKGYLSSRMLISDNPWVQMWESAKPVPANRQKRLFDDTREAEKVLHFLDSRTFPQIIEMLFPILSHAAICRLYDECEQVSAVLPSANKSLQQLIRLVQKLSRDNKITERLCGALIQQIAALELALSQANSLLYKLNPSGGSDESVFIFTEKLLNGCEVEIEGTSKSNIGNKLTSMLLEAQKLTNMILSEHGLVENSPTGNIIFPQANEREFVMRVSAVRPAPYSVKSPQFLRVILSKNEFRLVGAFSEDIVFF